jgi:tetratricopeptide (TPR) repeat protein
VQALLLGIGRDSVYYSEARNLIAELDPLAEANRAAGNGAGSAAATPGPAPLPTASPTMAPPTAAAVPEIRPEPVRVEPAKVSAGRPEVAANAGAGGDTEKRAKADIAEALRLYRDEKFDDAAAALEKAARRAPGTKSAKDAQGKAKAVREFAEQWAAAQKALRSRRAREASDALSRAAATDRRLGGHHREKIDGQLAEQLYMVAIQAYNRQAYDEAVQANGRVLEISPGHGLATRLQDKMRRSAMLIAKQAQQALDSGDRDAAKRLAQAALKLVNESDGAGKAARKVLDKL